MSTRTPQEALLGEIRQDFRTIANSLSMLTERIQTEGISEYPVFIAWKEVDMTLGKPMFNQEQHQLRLNYNITVLEDLIRKGIVKEEKAEQFINTFGEAEDKACMLLVSPDFTGLVFVPYTD